MLLVAFYAFSVNAQTGIIDKVVATVGSEAIFLSDIEEGKQLLRAQGMLIGDDSNCDVLEEKLLQKLLLAQSKIDSLSVSEEAVSENVERRIQWYISIHGSTKAVEDYFRIPMHKIRERLMDMVKEEELSKSMQGKIVQGVELTPEDVTSFYKRTPKDSLPIVPDQYILQQIVIYPSKENATFLARERLLALRERILNGEKFSMLALMYSEDPGSARRGGELGLAPATNYWPAFKDASLALKTGQVSQIVETQDGLHIIQMIEKQANNMVNVRHILIKPKYTTDDKQAVSGKLDSIKSLVLNDSLTFEQAAMKFSEDQTSRFNKGVVVNPQTVSNAFDKDQLGTDYFIIRNLKEGEISEPFESQDEKGNVIYKIIKIKEFIPSHTINVVEDFAMVKMVVQNTKRMEKFKEWINKKQAETFIQLAPEYQNCKFQYSNWGQ
jgi:peptidyl-prolyl cis-trans isomerase SurA